jgi:hypothetical protein
MKDSGAEHAVAISNDVMVMAECVECAATGGVATRKTPNREAIKTAAVLGPCAELRKTS